MIGTLKTLFTRRRKAGAGESGEPPEAPAASSFPSPGEVTSGIEVETDSQPFVNLGAIVLIFGFGGFLAWSGTAPLDEGVPAPGFVAVENQRKVVQHLRGGMIERIDVREGDRVSSGQVLVTLNAVDSKAQLDIVQAHDWMALSTEARLLAELDELPQVVFPDVLLASEDSRAEQAMSVQEGIFHSRRQSLESQVAILAETQRGLQEQIVGLESVESAKQAQLTLLKEEVRSMSEMVTLGYVPRVRQMEIERQIAELAGSRGSDLANIARIRSAINEARMRIVQLRRERQQEIQQQLAEVQKELEGYRNRLRTLDEELARSELRAPVDGVVVGLAVHTVGGVVQPGDTLMEIVPEGEGVLIETRIPVHLIEKVHPGLDAEVRFTTVKASQMPPIAGKLLTVSADRLLDRGTGQPYYLGRVQLTPAGMESLRKSKHEVIPGMQADVVIKTGERTLLEYLVMPLLNRIAGSLKEI